MGWKWFQWALILIFCVYWLQCAFYKYLQESARDNFHVVTCHKENLSS
jgi:hypothetical protein